MDTFKGLIISIVAVVGLIFAIGEAEALEESFFAFSQKVSDVVYLYLKYINKTT